jgi:hypothetical protein
LAAAHSTPSISAALQASGLQGLARSVHRNLGHQAQLIVGPRRKARLHARGVQHAGLLQHIALLDARGLFDELDAGVHHGRQFARGDARRVAIVLQIGVGVEGLYQFGIGDDVRRPEEAGAGDDDVFHGQAV